jgi:N-acetylmuramoyl-L-alanine amidase
MSAPAPDSATARDFRLSPNHGARRNDCAPDAIILHYTGMASAESALAWLTDPRSQVSCHYFVWEDGRITQLVPESRRAWHAGASFWRGERDINSVSLGIEIANPGHDFGAPPFPAGQIDGVVALCRDLTTRHRIAPERVLAHSDIAPARKRDPGEIFPWADLHAAGVGHWTPPAPLVDHADLLLKRGDSGNLVRALQEALGAYGYEAATTGDYDEGTERCVRAFQRHFRPARVDGEADRSTSATLNALLSALGASSVQF